MTETDIEIDESLFDIDEAEITIYDPNVSADTLEAGDQTIIDGDLVVILFVDTDRPDPDEVFVKVENLSGGDDEFTLYADDTYELWSV